MGERVGPLVTFSDIYDLALDLFEKTKGDNEEPFLFDPHMEQCINDYIENVIQGPAKNSTKYAAITASREEHMDGARKRAQFRKWVKKMASCNYRAKKIANAIKLIEAIGKKINHPRTRELLMYDINTDFCNGIGPCKWVPYIILRDNHVHHLLSRYLASPTKMMSKHTIKKIAKEIDDLYKNW